MAESRKNPESLKEIKNVKITEEIKSFVSEMSSDVETAKTDRATWEQNMDKYTSLRYGIRKKKVHPWPNCANFSVPLIDTDIARFKPSYINVTFAVSPVVTFIPYGSEDVDSARKKERLYDWRLRTQVKPFIPYNYGVDNLLHEGAMILKVIWRFETRNYTEIFDLEDFAPEVLDVLFDDRLTDDDLFRIIVEEFRVDLEFEENADAIQKAVQKFREGETHFEMDLIEVKENRPQWISRSLRDDVVIPFDTLLLEDNLDNAQFIDDKIWMSVNDLKIAMEDGKYEKFADEEIDSWSDKSDAEVNTKGTADLIHEDMVLLHETCVWFDVNGDGIKEKCICTWPDADPESVLRFIENPYDHGQFPYTMIKRELNDPGAYSSRGIPSLDEDYQIGISTALNQAVDNGTIVNTPHIVYKKNALANIRNRKYIPGEAVVVNTNINDYDVKQTVNASQGTLFQQAQYLKSWSDQRVGNLTSGVSDATNLPGAGEKGKKTAKEIRFIESAQNQVQSLSLQVFQQQMARVHCQTDALYDQFGDEEETILITGKPPEKVSRQEIQGRYNIIPNGRLDNASPELRAMKAFQLMQVFMGDPDIKQLELKKAFADDFDNNLSQRIFYTDEERQQMQIQQMQQQQLLKQQMTEEQVQLKRIENALDLEKEAGVEAIHGRRFAEG